jgi:hypothetical protein
VVLVAIGFIVFLFIVAPKFYICPKRKEEVNDEVHFWFKIAEERANKVFFYIKIACAGTLSVIALVILVSRTIIPSDECTYSLRNRIDVIPIGYNESMPPANFILSNNTYRFIPKTTKEDPIFSTADSSRTHINYTDGPAYIEVYEASGFKHNLTWIYGAPGACDSRYYEIYAPESTIQNAQSSE